MLVKKMLSLKVTTLKKSETQKLKRENMQLHLNYKKKINGSVFEGFLSNIFLPFLL